VGTFIWNPDELASLPQARGESDGKAAPDSRVVSC